jgi:hypothetical protein
MSFACNCFAAGEQGEEFMRKRSYYEAVSFKHYKHLSAGPILFKESTSAGIY